MVVDTFALIVGLQAAAAVGTADEAFVCALLAVRVVIVCCTPDIAVLSCDEKVSVVDCAIEVVDELCTSVHGVPGFSTNRMLVLAVSERRLWAPSS